MRSVRSDPLISEIALIESSIGADGTPHRMLEPGFFRIMLYGEMFRAFFGRPCLRHSLRNWFAPYALTPEAS